MKESAKRGVVISLIGLTGVLCPDAVIADWNPGEDAKWFRLPDRTAFQTGIDIKVDRNDGVVRMLADDFRCTNTTRITDVHLWGSWKDDDKGAVTNIWLGVYSDVAAGVVTNHSLPGSELWSRDFSSHHFKERQYAVSPSKDRWWDLVTGSLTFPDEPTIWQYNIRINPHIAFRQQGTPTNPVIYWLVVKVMTDGTGQFGWRTHDGLNEAPLGGAAVWSTNGVEWSALEYPGVIPSIFGDPIDMAFVITDTLPSPKWRQPLDTSYGVDVRSLYSGFTSEDTRVADDFVSDGRPITGIRWWGSYPGYQSGNPGPVAPPSGTERVGAFWVDWWADVPAGVDTNYSHPRGTTPKRSHLFLVDPTGPITEHYYTSIWHTASGWEHEFVYDVTFPTHAHDWNEKEGVVYWLGVEAYFDVDPLYGWGWATTPLAYHWNDDAVRANFPAPVWQELFYEDVLPGHAYGSNSVDMAFVLYSEVAGRRARKWSQPPDMRYGENMPSWWNGVQAFASSRADDFVSDGRRITDIHWWGSYLDYETDWHWISGLAPSSPTGDDAPLGFRLSWHGDTPGPGFSRPAEPPLREILVPIENCHEVFYGTVTQYWKTSSYQEHEYQYYVDLLDPGLGTDAGAWPEQSNVVYWLNVQAVFSTSFVAGALHDGWGWKTTPTNFQWNDVSVLAGEAPEFNNWAPGRYPAAHPHGSNFHLPSGLPMDLAFELTTDEVATSRWYSPIVIKTVDTPDGTNYTVGSEGDWGAGAQILQYSTNLTLPNWVDVVTNPVPWPPGWTNLWFPSTSSSAAFWRVLQRK